MAEAILKTQVSEGDTIFVEYNKDKEPDKVIVTVKKAI